MEVKVERGVRTVVLTRDEFLRAICEFLRKENAAPDGFYDDITVTLANNRAIVTMAAEPTLSITPVKSSGLS